MKHTRDQKRAQLLAAAQAVIEEFLDWEEQANRPNLTALADEVLRVCERFGQRLAEVALADQDAQQPAPAPAPACPSCGQALRYKGPKRVDTESRVGLLTIARGHYYCARCPRGLFPPEDQLALWDGHWSAAVARDAMWLSGVAPAYAAAEASLPRIGRLNISCRSVWRRVQVWGEQFKALAAACRTATA